MFICRRGSWRGHAGVRAGVILVRTAGGPDETGSFWSGVAGYESLGRLDGDLRPAVPVGV